MKISYFFYFFNSYHPPIHTPSLGLCEIPHVNWAWLTLKPWLNQRFSRLSDTNNQTNSRAKYIYLYIYKVVVSVCLFACPIITQEPLDRFGWGNRESHGNVFSFKIIDCRINYEKPALATLGSQASIYKKY